MPSTFRENLSVSNLETYENSFCNFAPVAANTEAVRQQLSCFHRRSIYINNDLRGCGRMRTSELKICRISILHCSTAIRPKARVSHKGRIARLVVRTVEAGRLCVLGKLSQEGQRPHLGSDY